MFDGDVDELDPDAALAAAADLHALSHRAEAKLLQVAAHWADLHAPDDSPVLSGEERALVYGGEGCPKVGEFACADLGAALGMSSRAAAGLISDALGLRHRMPRLWAAVLAGRVAPWRARRIAHNCVTLSREAAGVVDSQVAEIANRVGEWRLRRIMDAAILAVDPEQAQANADAMARERGVWVGQSDSYGTKRMSIKAAAGDIARLDARIDQVADILAELGDLDCKDLRRAKAIGWMADPHLALELIINAASAQADDGDAGAHADPDAYPDPDSDADTDADLHPDAGAQSDPDPDPDVEADAASCADAAAADADAASSADASAGIDGAAEARAGARRGAETDEFGAAGTAVGDDDEAGATVGASGHPGTEPDVYTVGCADDDAASEQAERKPGVDSEAGSGHEPTGLDGRLALLAELRGGRVGSSVAPTGRRARGGGPTGSRYELYVHLTDQTLATGTGVLRTETVGRGKVTADDLGPLLASQLAELLGPNPGTIIVRPVIDLRDQVSIDAYEIPDRIRERVRLRYPVCIFPWCNRPAVRCDLDHITPHARDGTGPPGQTGTENLGPACRFHHRIKTHGGWSVERLPDGAFVWTSPHGDIYLVDHDGTRLIRRAISARPTDLTGEAAA